MKKWIICLMVLFLFVWVKAEKVATLNEIFRTDQVEVDKDRLYIVDHTKVFVYSLKNYKLEAKFGEQGEGPKEFKIRPGDRVYVYPIGNYIYVDSLGKVSIFTKKGEYVKEMRAVKGAYFTPVGDNAFVAEGSIEDGKNVYTTINIFDKNLNMGKELYRRMDIFQKNTNTAMLFDVALAFKASKDRIFITGEEGFVVSIFDLKGKELFKIEREYKKRPITQKDKDDVFDWYKHDPRYNEEHYQRIKQILRFPDYFPAIEDIIVKDEKLYVRTYNVKDDKYELVVFDMNGKYLNTYYVYLKRMNPLEPYDFDIANGNIYQVIEDEETEKWDLHILPIK